VSFRFAALSFSRCLCEFLLNGMEVFDFLNCNLILKFYNYCTIVNIDILIQCHIHTTYLHKGYIILYVYSCVLETNEMGKACGAYGGE
jgi:hypothetical protein